MQNGSPQVVHEKEDKEIASIPNRRIHWISWTPDKHIEPDQTTARPKEMPRNGALSLVAETSDDVSYWREHRFISLSSTEVTA